MEITATFKGQNGSLGYEAGKVYELKIARFGGMEVTRLDGSGRCRYHSISGFLRNWTNIKTRSWD